MSNIIHGARAVVYINSQLCGSFSDVTYRFGLEAQPASVLGRYEPIEIDYTGQEPVALQATGWRAIKLSPHDTEGAPNVPRTIDLLTAGYINAIEIFDRKTGLPIFKVEKVRSLGYRGGQSVRQLSQVTFDYIGISADTENSQSASGRQVSGPPDDLFTPPNLG